MAADFDGSAKAMGAPAPAANGAVSPVWSEESTRSGRASRVSVEWRDEDNGERIQSQDIRTSSEALLVGLSKRLSKERERRDLIDFYELLRSLFEVRIFRGAEQVRVLFSQYASFASEEHAGSYGMDLTAEIPDALRDDADANTIRLASTIHSLAERCNFEPLSQAVFDFACETDFECAIDQKMQTSLLENSFVTHLRTSSQHSSDFIGSADLCNHCLVYHRGMGTAARSGFFAMEKIDILLKWIMTPLVALFLRPVRFLWRLLWTSLLDEDDSPSEKSSTPLPSGGDDGPTSPAPVDSNLDTTTADGMPSPPPTPADADERLPEAIGADRAELNRKFVRQLRAERVSLEDTLWAKPQTFFQTIELHEPTFKEVMLVYRTEEECENAFRMQRHPQLQVSLFRDIPVADFETILPAQKPLTRAFDIFKLLLVFVGVIVYIIRTLESQAELETADIDDIIDSLLPAVVGLIGYASKIIISWRKMQRVYQDTILKFLSTYYLAKQEAVLPLLLNEMLQQELKEALLAYYFLWKSPNDTPRLLDDECEHHLHSYHGENIDFDVHDAIIKLKQCAIVHYEGPLTDETQLAYMSIGRAVNRLSDAIIAHMSTKNRMCPYCEAGICRTPEH
mmetsp:Transcript_11365/g.34215  ORF Transcript_11365/g.34215 Transcript_11365/m.34215 type:complete len:624 (-) Transcript_11365:189-2060(-)|eukprot:CAMPEP_0182922542 /NCGR_PEP_ID=MMETSP0105_2-20130417/4867_1 /TAXON_ID=81532 ORGANISM="Acanthoeca-like sp., Strain 10tr" /NCGR_SAMPLE_ID=MMETSP0105_2 /ASSEMBLY_ACC=CAM_ASM_000205 /LENGTH=623 /DNA_ID=CAMNT_0025060173 /DNA_START=160 /DNA_END=2031 /DNA_ORIENTATION=+